jgi:hypothetical protein
VRAIAKRKAKLDAALKKGYATVWDQCSQETNWRQAASGGRSLRRKLSQV